MVTDGPAGRRRVLELQLPIQLQLQLQRGGAGRGRVWHESRLDSELHRLGSSVIIRRAVTAVVAQKGGRFVSLFVKWGLGAVPPFRTRVSGGFGL